MKSIKVTDFQLEILASALVNRVFMVGHLLDVFTEKEAPTMHAKYLNELKEVKELQKMLEKKLAA